MSFAAIQMYLEIVILNDVNQRQIFTTYMWNLNKNDTNTLIYKTKIELQIQKISTCLPGAMRGMDKLGHWD